MGKKFKCDLHIHTLLSPCAEMEMMPTAIVKHACNAGLDIIAITDHNTTSNVESVVIAGQKLGLKVIPGIEIQTKEEAHIVGLFNSVESAKEVGDKVRKYLPGIQNDENYFGLQILMDSDDEILGQEDIMLLNSTDLSLEESVDLILSFHGLPICAHVDRPSYSVISQLGFIPPDLPVKAVEISRRSSVEEEIKEHPYLSNYRIITSSDAHRLNEIGSCFVEINKSLISQSIEKMILEG